MDSNQKKDNLFRQFFDRHVTFATALTITLVVGIGSFLLLISGDSLEKLSSLLTTTLVSDTEDTLLWVVNGLLSLSLIFLSTLLLIIGTCFKIGSISLTFFGILLLFGLLILGDRDPHPLFKPYLEM